MKINSDTPKIFTDPYERIVGVANTQYLTMALNVNYGDKFQVPKFEISNGAELNFKDYE